MWDKKETSAGTALDFLPGEAWFGGAVTDGLCQPYTADCCRTLELLSLIHI